MIKLAIGTAVWNLVGGAEAYLLTPPSDGEIEPDAVELADEFLVVRFSVGTLTAQSTPPTGPRNPMAP
jgi:hypothetical protein